MLCQAFDWWPGALAVSLPKIAQRPICFGHIRAWTSQRGRHWYPIFKAQPLCGTRHGQRGVIRTLDKPSGMKPKAFPSACQGHSPICHHSSCVAAHFNASTGSSLNPPLRCEAPSTTAQVLSCWTKIDAVEPASRMLMRWLWSLVHACPWAGASAA